MERQKNNKSIIELNRDMEEYVIQASSGRAKAYHNDKYKPLEFIHFSDIHAVIPLWNRIVEYANAYRDYIKFALHTGDYVADCHVLKADFYGIGDRCRIPIMNCVGNHDTYLERPWAKSDKKIPHDFLFARKDEWGATFADIEASMTYYKDFEESGIRLVVLDNYYHQEEQMKWLEEILKDAKAKGFGVITAMHQPSGRFAEPVDCTFNSANYEEISKEIEDIDKTEPSFDAVIAEFKELGGEHICNLVGHKHNDLIGYTKRGVLNIAVECATDWNYFTDSLRDPDDRSYDCFNVVSVDVNEKTIKLIRIGNNVDHLLRDKRVLCYSYANKKVIWNR